MSVKEETIKRFFEAYMGSVESSLNDMGREEAREYLTDDTHIFCVATATGISKLEFVQYAMKHIVKQPLSVK